MNASTHIHHITFTSWTKFQTTSKIFKKSNYGFILFYLLTHTLDRSTSRRSNNALLPKKKFGRGMFAFFTGNRAQQYFKLSFSPLFSAVLRRSCPLVSHFINSAHFFTNVLSKVGSNCYRYAKPHGIIWYTIQPMESSV